MAYAKVKYGVTKVDNEHLQMEISFTGPPSGGLVHATDRDPPEKYVKPDDPPSGGYGKTWVAIGGELCDLDPPCDMAYYMCTRNGDFRM